MRTFLSRILFFAFGLIIPFPSIFAHVKPGGIPSIRAIGTTKQLIVDGKPFIMLAGEVNNSSSSSMKFMENSWKKLSDFKLNTVLLPVSWEQIEPQEGKFDFSLVKELILKARQNHLKVVFLWFGTWKNASSSYAPPWVRQNFERFSRSETVDGQKLNHISPFSNEACLADAKSFGEFMKFIKNIDEKENTVIAVQVENESGIRKQERDFSDLSNESFNEKIPEKLSRFLLENKNKLVPKLDKIGAKSNYKTEGTWTEIFGSDANLLFMSWYSATYIEKVASAGKAIYPLPLFVNAWLEWGDDNKPGDYPSGGPIAKMIPIWQVAAPHIDILAPDIYRPDFANVCKLYQRMGNPLFIPETHPGMISSANVFYAVGEGAVCFSPFGIDNEKWFTAYDPIAKSYHLLTQLMPYIQQFQGTGKMCGLLGSKGEKQEIILGNYKLLINYTGNQNPDLPGFGLVIALPDDEFLVAGKGFTITFISEKDRSKRSEILTAYELIYKSNSWGKQRQLNGDETDHNDLLKLQDDQLTVITAKLFTYR